MAEPARSIERNVYKSIQRAHKAHISGNNVGLLLKKTAATRSRARQVSFEPGFVPVQTQLEHDSNVFRPHSRHSILFARAFLESRR